MLKTVLAAAVLGSLAIAAAAVAQEAPAVDKMVTDAGAEGARVWEASCNRCHSSFAPPKAELASKGADEVLKILTEGVMKPMAASLNPAEIRAVAMYVTQKPLPADGAAPAPPAPPAAAPAA